LVEWLLWPLRSALQLSPPSAAAAAAAADAAVDVGGDDDDGAEVTWSDDVIIPTDRPHVYANKSVWRDKASDSITSSGAEQVSPAPEPIATAATAALDGETVG